MTEQTKHYRMIRTIARILSLLSIGFVLLFVVGETLSEQGSLPTSVEWVALAFFPTGVVVGLVIAWWREGLGGGIALLSLLAFYAWEFAYSGDLAGGPFFFLVAAPGLLFLIYAWLFKRAFG